MQESGLRARPRCRGLPKDTGERVAVSDNLLVRAFKTSAPNQKWIADFTYIWTAEVWLYIAAVVDLFSQRVVGLAMKAELTSQLLNDALIMAIWRRGRNVAGCAFALGHVPKPLSGHPAAYWLVKQAVFKNAESLAGQWLPHV